MKALCLFLVVAVVGSAAIPSATKENVKNELFSGVPIEKNVSGEDNINVKFKQGEIIDVARAFNEARGKVKKYTPLLTSIGVKIIVSVVIFFTGALMLLTKSLILTKLAFIAAYAMGFHKYFSGSSFSNIGGFDSLTQQWTSPSETPPYSYARSAMNQDGIDLAYSSQIPS